ncbi:hypothetical protein AAC387_Pa01g4068 [Persea americana]
MALLLLLLVVGFLAAPAAAQDLETAETCQDKCGDVLIPYPFGIGDSKCFRNEKFRINCTGNSTTPYKTILLTGSSLVEVMHISVLGHMSIRSSIGASCPGNKSIPSSVPYISLGDGPYTLSSTRNKFTAIGCDFFGILEGSKEDGRYWMTSCLSYCKDRARAGITEGACFGSGCCQFSIPDGLKTIEGFTRGWDSQQNDNCTFTFLVDQEQFIFSTSDLRGTNFYERSKDMQVMVDWVVERETCEEAKTNKTAYACRSDNSYCYNSTNGHGYRCNCSNGYEGNPYVDKGCKDIDECKEKDNNLCDAIATCKNTEGGYYCTCPKGTHGDGKKDGEGCTKDDKEFPIMQVVLGTGLSFLFLLIGSTWAYWLWRKRKISKLKEKFFQQNGGMLLQQKISSHRAEAFKIFTAEELKRATDNYNVNKVLGQGGFGIVYKGVLPNNRIVAIKKSKVVDTSQIEQFVNEVDILSQINHRNVVKLLGCCLEAEVPLLVYEFVSNGTLSHHIHDTDDVPFMSLRDRLRIAEEIADALSYLHSAASMPIFHRDIKSANILLDNSFNAKVSDFGASRLVPIDQTQIATLVQGTFGYLDPEYFQTGQLTSKSDVYSFGVVLAELLTGQKPVCFNRTEEERNLAMYFLLAMKENRLLQVVDNRILKEGREEQLTAIARLVKHCVRLKGEERPTMKEVVVELRGLRGFQEHPWVISNIEETENLLVKNPNVGASDSKSVAIIVKTQHNWMELE